MGKERFVDWEKFRTLYKDALVNGYPKMWEEFDSILEKYRTDDANAVTITIPFSNSAYEKLLIEMEQEARKAAQKEHEQCRKPR